MAELFGYRYGLQIGDQAEYLDIQLRDNTYNLGQGLRISFLVQHDFGGFVSYAEISIYNLKTENEERIFEKYRSVTLQAGWPELYGAIFKGQVINYQRITATDDGTRGIKLFCRSSAESLTFSYVNKTFAPETEIIEIIRTVAASIGNPVTFSGDFSDIPKRSRGTVLKGDPKRLLDRMAVWFDYNWSIENGATKIVRNGATVDGEMYLFSPQTGMIGSPVVGDGEVSVRVALNPAVQLGRNIQIKSTAPEFAFSGAYYVNIPRSIGEGIFQVRRINHVGDSFSPVWESQLTCFRLADVMRDDIATRAAQ